MQLAAPFCMGMLGWYAWYETGKKFWLFDLYFFGGLATLAKGPVAIFLSLSIIVLFVGLRREWQVLRRMIWLPGIALFLAISLPWFIAVQLRNPTFYKFFLFEQNLQRFATDRYQHHQNPFFYVIVLVLALMPWTVLALRALWDSVEIAWAEWRVRHRPARYLGHSRAGDAFPEFLVLWAVFPDCLFLVFRIEAARLHSAGHPADHDSHRRLPLSRAAHRPVERAADRAWSDHCPADLCAAAVARNTWSTSAWCRPRRHC